MAITSKFLRDIEAEARPIIERQMNDAKIIAGLRDVVAAAGGDWGALKALIKARVEDDNDETGEGKRVRKIREKADCIVAYDDMLGSNMNEKNFSASQSYAEAKGRDAGSSSGRTAEFDSANAGSNPAPVASGELTDTQEQPGEPATQSGQLEPAVVFEASGALPDESPEADAAKSETMAGSASALSPSPANAPRLAADDEAAQANPIVVGNLSNPQPNLLPGAVKAPEADSSPASGAVLSDADVPAFLRTEQRKSIADYRPNCLNPDACGATGLQHCYTCRKAMEAASETEAA